MTKSEKALHDRLARINQRAAVLAKRDQRVAGEEFDLLQFLENETKAMLEIARRKNADYAGSSKVDPFANFRRVEDLGIATTEQGMLTRMTDKLCRVATFTRQGELQVKDESVQDTLRDLANYSLLMLAYIEWKKLKGIK